MRDSQIAALEAEVAQLRAENARLRERRSKSPVVVLQLARRGVRPWIACVLVGASAWIGYAIK